MEGALVYLNVYDLVPQNEWVHFLGLGIYHTGVEVYNREFAFGGHEYDLPGVFYTEPKAAPGTVACRESILVGRTSLSPQAVYQLIQSMGQEYKGNRYHLLQCNCNTFASDLCYRLTGKTAPHYINRLANFAISVHCLLPQTWLPPLRPPSGIPGQNLLDNSTTSAPPPTGAPVEDERAALLNELGSPYDSSSATMPHRMNRAAKTRTTAIS